MIMESQRFHHSKITVICNLAFCIHAFGCSKNDEEVTPANDDKPKAPIAFISKTIGSGGGSIVLNSMAIYVPAGAFISNIDLELAVEKDPSTHLQPAVTDRSNLMTTTGVEHNSIKPKQL
jgi:hypothetical protein